MIDKYESQDHPGNVRATFGRDQNGDLEVFSYADYYPFGWKIPTRQANPNEYRFGYQGEFAEQEEETGWNSFELRMYDGRVGRWMTKDPYKEFHSPYLAMGNNPINLLDPNGGQVEDTYTVDRKGNFTKIDDKQYFDDQGNEVDLLIYSTGKVKYRKNGDLKNPSIFVKSGFIKQALKEHEFSYKDKRNRKHTINFKRIFFSKYESEATTLFEFLGTNTQVEWALFNLNSQSKENTETLLFTSHQYDAETVGATEALRLAKRLNYHIHSHPNTHKIGDQSRLRASDKDDKFAKQIRKINPNAGLRIFFNGQYISY